MKNNKSHLNEAVKFADFVVSYIKRPGFIKEFEKKQADLSVFKSDPVKQSYIIMDIIQKSDLVKKLLCVNDYDDKYIEYRKFKDFYIKNKYGVILLHIEVVNILELVTFQEITEDNIHFNAYVGHQLDIERNEVDNFIFFKNEFDNDKSKQELSKLVNHMKFLEESFDCKETRFLRLDAIKKRPKSKIDFEDYNITEIIHFAGYETGCKDFLDLPSIDYAFERMKSFWSIHNIFDAYELEGYIRQYNDMKDYCKEFEVKINMYLNFWQGSGIASFMMTPNTLKGAVFGIKFEYKGNKIFNIQDFNDIELEYLYAIKGQYNSGYFVSDLIKGGKDLWTQIKMLEY